ncbi:MAG: CopG family transcriptional regulator [Verrucomicrobiae bacterium]
MNGMKISVSLPKDLWDFVEREKTATGRRGTSHVIQDAIDLLRKSRDRAAKYRKAKKQEAAK